MAAATQPDGFLTLPAELQVKVYKYVLAAAPKAPGPGNLAPYAGLLLSCKKVASDFEYEWAKHYNARLQHIVENTCFHPLPVKQSSTSTPGPAVRSRIKRSLPSG
ncbi:hypothetical protein J4E85_003894 [Alternaria conjuncta]|uniref:uncharacterized protein n=1 Tax=Alternaria conjuncta TaxID=181017 RepID=UPI002220EDD3|nr:uncharacterized protein J4E85_003894 [Alternaria conjuncta]KAI4931304.1 hypothetical protein J4E85_003894 [Alternaria conjuncta]